MANQRALNREKADTSSKRNNDLKVKMKKGYFQMGKINLELAEQGLKAEKEAYKFV